ncbi:MAG: hypothetical protein ACREOI_34840 [bacterium]
MRDNDYFPKAKDLIQSGEVKDVLNALLEIYPGQPFFLQAWQNTPERPGEE